MFPRPSLTIIHPVTRFLILTCPPPHHTPSQFYGDYDCVAGEYCTYTIDAHSTVGVRQYRGGDRWLVEVVDKPNPRASVTSGGGVDGVVMYDDMGDGVYHASDTELYHSTAEEGAWYTPARPAREGQGVGVGQFGLGLGSQRRVSHTLGNISDVGNGTYAGGWSLDVQVPGEAVGVCGKTRSEWKQTSPKAGLGAE